MRKQALASLVLLLVALDAFAASNQSPAAKGAPHIEDLMTPATFKKAGLDQLSQDQLAALNTWLAQYKVAIMSGTDGSSALPESVENSDATESHISGDFEGWSGDTIFKLDNGQTWQQASYAYAYHYAYHPKVLILRAAGVYRMQVEGMTQSIPVRQLSDVIESYIEGAFEGWDGDTIFKLANGQIWKQASVSILVHVAINPKVTIYRSGGTYKMQVESVDQSVAVTRLR